MDYLLLLGVTIAVFAIALTGMSVGVLFSNREIKGTCGGLANMTDSKGHSICDACTNPAPECRGEKMAQEQGSSEPESCEH